MAISEEITKVEAAERQLNTAIRLFFQREEMVAVHTLASAATQVLTDVASARGIKNALRKSNVIRPEMKKEFIKLMNEPQNFFKHADKDPDGILKFYPESTMYHIYEGVVMHNTLTKGFSPETHVFANWFALKHPYLISEEGKYKSTIMENLAKGLNVNDYEIMLGAIRKLKSK